MPRNNFDVFVGGLSGVFKGVEIGKQNTNNSVVKNIQSLQLITNDDQVTTLAWSDDTEKEVLIACGVKGNRSVKIYDTESSAFTCSFHCNVGEGSINGISKYDDMIMTAVRSGEVKLWKFEEENDEVLIRAGPDLEKMRHSQTHRNIIATGGKEHRLQLFDLETQKRTFLEKDLPHDWLQLRVPVWISDIDFLPGTDEIVTCGRYGHVRLYDPKSMRRPVIKLEMPDDSLFTLAITPREKQIIVGSGKGRMNLIDLRNPGRILNLYKGFTGGVTSIGCSTINPYIVSVGLDRYLRVHHMNTKKLLKKVYLTSKISCMVMRSEFDFAQDHNNQNSNDVDCIEADNNINHSESILEKENGRKTSAKEVESEEEYDELFENMKKIESTGDGSDVESNAVYSARSKRKKIKLDKKK